MDDTNSQLAERLEQIIAAIPGELHDQSDAIVGVGLVTMQLAAGLTVTTLMTKEPQYLDTGLAMAIALLKTNLQNEHDSDARALIVNALENCKEAYDKKTFQNNRHMVH